MSWQSERHHPALFRAGDIGVSSEWRDLSYDWWPIVTMAGIGTYTMLRDSYAHQRNLFPFLLEPEGPAKTQIQYTHGYKTGNALRGSEYLLEVVGLVVVTTGYRPSPDPDRPFNTRVAYYTVGRLARAELDMAMVGRVLDAVMPAMNPEPGDTEGQSCHRRAQDGLRSLAQAGVLQNAPTMFDPWGVWPFLLPVLIQDNRWVTLFTHLYGQGAMEEYREEARAWAEWAQRAVERKREQNDVLSERLRAAQVEVQRLGLAGKQAQRPGISPVPDHRVRTAGDTMAVGKRLGTAHTDPTLKNETGVSGHMSPAVDESMSRGTLNPASKIETRSPLTHDLLYPDAIHALNVPSGLMSPTSDQLIERKKGKHRSTSDCPETPRSGDTGTTEGTNTPELPLLARHLRTAELASTTFDDGFWCAVNMIYGRDQTRYERSEAEKKMLQRIHKELGKPAVGVLLAALRGVSEVMAREGIPLEQVHPLHQAMKHALFVPCCHASHKLVPTQQAEPAPGTFQAFLHAYRQVGLTDRLRDVNIIDYPVLESIYRRTPDACWQVLSNVAHAANLPYLTPRYLQAAVAHNQRAEMLKAEAARGPCPSPSYVPGHGNTKAMIQAAPPPRLDPVSVPDPSCVPDKRMALLEQHGLDPAILTNDMTLPYIEAWVDYVAREAERINDPTAYLSATLPRGKWPRQDRGDRARSPRAGRTKERGMFAELPKASIPSSARSAARAETDEQQLWPDVLAKLKGLVEPNEFDTWLQDTSVVTIDDGVGIVSAPNVFARDMLDRHYTKTIEVVLAEVIGVAVQVRFVIE